MDTIELAEHFVSNHPQEPDARVLQGLLQSLRSSTPFDLAELYELPLRSFELAMQVLVAWRLQRYYRGPVLPSVDRGTGAH